MPGRPASIVLEPASPGFQLLQRIRDEAHRFALGFHRQRRDSRALWESISRRLPGVGPGAPPRAHPALRRLARSASSPRGAEELEGVPGVPAKTAQRRSTQRLHKAG